MKQSLLRKYAALIVRSGLAVKKGQTVIINASVENEAFTALVVEECYKAKAKNVIVDWNSEAVTRVKMRRGDKDVLGTLLPQDIERQKWMNEELPCTLFLDSDDPDGLGDLDQEKLAYVGRKRRQAIYPYRKLRENKYQWCIAGVPSVAWAQKVFPGEWSPMHIC